MTQPRTYIQLISVSHCLHKAIPVSTNSLYLLILKVRVHNTQVIEVFTRVIDIWIRVIWIRVIVGFGGVFITRIQICPFTRSKNMSRRKCECWCSMMCTDYSHFPSLSHRHSLSFQAQSEMLQTIH